MTALPTQDEARDMLAQFQQQREREQIEAMIRRPTQTDRIARQEEAK